MEIEAETKNGTATAENHAEAVKFLSVHEGFAGESGNRSGNEKRYGNGAKITPKRLSFRLSVRDLQAKEKTEAEAKNGTATVRKSRRSASLLRCGVRS